MASAGIKELLSPFRNLSIFLLELCELDYTLFLPYMSLLPRYLDGNSYSLRNAALSIMGEMIIKTRQTAIDEGILEEKNEDDEGQTRETYFIYIKDHIYDTNAFVRSKCFQILCRIYSSSNMQALPRSIFPSFLNKAQDRLNDKSSNVRKNALQFLTLTLTCNGHLSIPLDILAENIKVYEQKIAQNLMKCADLVSSHMVNLKNNNEQNLMTQIIDGHDKNDLNIGEQKDLDQHGDGEGHVIMDEKINELNKQIKQDMANYDYMKFCLEHSTLVTQEIYPTVLDTMIYSKNQTDCIEAISFLVTGLKLKIHRLGMLGIKACLNHLSYSGSNSNMQNNTNTDSIKEKVVNTFANLFFAATEPKSEQDNDCEIDNDNRWSKKSNNKTAPSKDILNNFLDFLEHLDDNEMISFEELVKEFLKLELFPNDFPSLLMQKSKMISNNLKRHNPLQDVEQSNYSNDKTLLNTTTKVEYSRLINTFKSLIEFIRMLELGSQDIDNSLCWNNMETLIHLGLDDYNEIDRPDTDDNGTNVLNRARILCTAMIKLRRETKILEGKVICKARRLPTTHIMFTKMINLLISKFDTETEKNDYWSPLAQVVIELIYSLCENPEFLCHKILSTLTVIYFPKRNGEIIIKGLLIFNEILYHIW
ncbi:uncharacterized protein LOC135924297 [Gordionus sp. m RMFG-2023]|uniref:uncharacterized protein LOC135924297 n=1 Tax=Gordionus sp. m RMFG-2023 TaxID=3053472 RepID=UPI0031FE2F3F